jgi:hypothetical protein
MGYVRARPQPSHVVEKVKAAALDRRAKKQRLVISARPYGGCLRSALLQGLGLMLAL